MEYREQGVKGEEESVSKQFFSPEFFTENLPFRNIHSSFCKFSEEKVQGSMNLLRMYCEFNEGFSYPFLLLVLKKKKSRQY